MTLETTRHTVNLALENASKYFSCFKANVRGSSYLDVTDGVVDMGVAIGGWGSEWD